MFAHGVLTKGDLLVRLGKLSALTDKDCFKGANTRLKVGEDHRLADPDPPPSAPPLAPGDTFSWELTGVFNEGGGRISVQLEAI